MIAAWFAALRHRRIFHWAVGYLAGAWLLYQALSLLSDNFAWPPLFIQAATVVLGIGFFAALVLAWYHGERGHQRVGTVELLMLIALLAIAGSSVAFLARGNVQQAPSWPQSAALQLLPPEGHTFQSVTVSPDGARIAFCATDANGNASLWIRAIDDAESVPVPGTEGASYPFWSTDSRFVGFFADGKLKKVDVRGGSPQTIATLVNARGGPRGATWSHNGDILFAVWAFGPSPIYRVSAQGGEVLAVETNESAGVRSMRWWPSFLPDGRHFLYLAVMQGKTGVYVGSLDSPQSRLLLSTDTASTYAPVFDRGAGYLLFVRERTLFAQRLDPRRLAFEGDAIPVADKVGADRAAAHAKISVADNGVLVYGAGIGTSQLVWRGRNGRALAAVGTPGLHIDFTISPDGQSVAVQREDEVGRADISLLDFERGTSSRFTFDPTYNAAPIWQPDGRHITYFAVDGMRWVLRQRAAETAEPSRLLLEAKGDLVTSDWSTDGKHLLYAEIDSSRNTDLWVVARDQLLSGKNRGVPFVRSPADENFGRFSPNGRWVAYQSDQSGRYEIYVRRFPAEESGPGGILVSSGGGVEPRWPALGSEIFYIAPDNRLMVVEVETGETFQANVPRPLFATRPAGVLRYDVAPGGQQFLIATPIDEAIHAPATVLLNWVQHMRRRTPR